LLQRLLFGASRRNNNDIAGLFIRGGGGHVDVGIAVDIV
jgi:hypothetical protein